MNIRGTNPHCLLLPEDIERWVRSFVALLDEIDRGLRPVTHLRSLLDRAGQSQLRQPSWRRSSRTANRIRTIAGQARQDGWDIVVLLEQDATEPARAARRGVKISALGLRIRREPGGEALRAREIVRPGVDGGAIRRLREDPTLVDVRTPPTDRGSTPARRSVA